MGQHAEDIIDQYCDSLGDYTPNYKVRIHSCKDTPAEAKIRDVRRELAKLIKSRLAAGERNAVEGARQLINLKYGKGWRERGLISNSDNQWKELKEYPLKEIKL